MNKENSHIDNGLKEKFEQHDFGVPPESFLVDINKRLDKKAWIDPFVWWILEFGLLLCFGTLLFYGRYPQEIIHTTQYTPENNRLERTEITEDYLPQKDNDYSLSKTAQGTTINKSNEVQIAMNNGASKKDAGMSKTSTQTGEPSNDRTNTSKNKAAISFNTSASDDRAGGAENASKGQNIPVQKKNKSQNSPKNETKSSKSEKPKANDDVDNKKSNKFDIYATDYAVVDDQIKSNPVQDSSFAKNSVPKEAVIEAKDSVKKKPLKEEVASHFEIQGFVGASYGFPRNTKSFSDSYSEQLKNGTENDELSPHFGININFVRKNIVIGTGIQYFQFIEEIENTNIKTITTDSIFISGYNTVSYFDSITQQLDTMQVPYYDSTQITKTTKNKIEVEQRYSWVSIPIQIGYRFQLGNKWAITPSVGGNIAFGILRKTYQYPSDDFKQMDDYQSVKWMLSLQGNLEVRRKINNWHVFIRGGYHFGLTPYINSNSFQRKYSQVTGTFGVGYSF